MSKKLLIDGSSLAFVHGNKENYKETIKSHVEGLLSRYKTREFLIILEKSSTCFRNKVAVTQEYKGNRKEHRLKYKDYLPYLGNCFVEIKENYEPLLYLGIENDDAFGIISSRLDDCVIAGNDRDLLVIPGEHHNIKSNVRTFVKWPGKIWINEKGKYKSTGLYTPYFQVLKGSIKENYKGVPGCGDKCAYNLLKDLTTEEEMQKACRDKFYTHYGHVKGKRMLEEGFRLCWIILENEQLKTPEMVNYDGLYFNLFQ